MILAWRIGDNLPIFLLAKLSCYTVHCHIGMLRKFKSSTYTQLQLPYRGFQAVQQNFCGLLIFKFIINDYSYVIGFMKTDSNHTRTEIHFTLYIPRHTKHIAKDGQVCFHKSLFANPVKPQRYTTETVRPLDGINKDVGGAKLLLTATSVYPVHCACFCLLLKRQHHCLCPNRSCNPPSASHPPPPPPYPLIHATHDITVTVKRLLKSSSVSQLTEIAKRHQLNS